MTEHKPLRKELRKDCLKVQVGKPVNELTDLSFFWASDIYSAVEGLKKEMCQNPFCVTQSNDNKEVCINCKLIDKWFGGNQ